MLHILTIEKVYYPHMPRWQCFNRSWRLLLAVLRGKVYFAELKLRKMFLLPSYVNWISVQFYRALDHAHKPRCVLQEIVFIIVPWFSIPALNNCIISTGILTCQTCNAKCKYCTFVVVMNSSNIVSVSAFCLLSALSLTIHELFTTVAIVFDRVIQLQS